MRFGWILIAAALIGGCAPPSTSAVPCNDDGDCSSNHKCRGGFCAASTGAHDVLDAPIDGGVASGGRVVDGGAEGGVVDGGGSPVSDGGALDAGAIDAGIADAAGANAGDANAGDADAGDVDAGVVDAGVGDASVDAGVVDAGVVDASVDAGVVDAGVVDAGVVDAGVVDAGPCGTLEVIGDDFEDPALHRQWGRWLDPGVQLEEVGGAARIEAPAGETPGYAGYFSRALYPLVGASVSVEAALVPVAAGTEAWFGIDAVTDDQLHISVSEGALHVAKRISGGNWTSVPLGPFSPSAHRFWRLGESQGSLVFETSPDETSWTVQHTEPIGPFSQSARLVFGGGAWTAQTSPTVIRFDNVNGGVRAGRTCPSSALTSDFTTFASDRLFEWESPGCQAEVVSGAARFSCDETAQAQSGAGFSSLAAYDVRGQALTLEVPGIDFAPDARAFFKAQFNGDDDKVEFWLADGVLRFGIQQGGAGTELGALQVIPFVAPRWWRLRFEGTTVVWETSTTGATWVERARVDDVTLPLEEAHVQLGTWNGEAPTGPTQVRMDNLNLPP